MYDYSQVTVTATKDKGGSWRVSVQYTRLDPGAPEQPSASPARVGDFPDPSDFTVSLGSFLTSAENAVRSKIGQPLL